MLWVCDRVLKGHIMHRLLGLTWRSATGHVTILDGVTIGLVHSHFFFGLVLNSHATSSKLTPANVGAVGGAVMGFVSVHLLLVFF